MTVLPSDATLFEEAPCGLLVAHVDGSIAHINATLCRWLGYDRAELIGLRRIQDLLTVGGRVFLQTHCMPLLQIQGSVSEVQFELLHRDQTRIPVLINIVRRQRGAAKFDEFALFVAADRRKYERELLAARRAAETSLAARLSAEVQLQNTNARLAAADRRKDEFLATLAHELRNPLAPMRNVVELLKRAAPGTAPGQWQIAVLERQLKQMVHLVDDLMDVSRISQGRIVLRRTPVDLIAIVKSAIDDARAMLDAAAHVLAVDFPSNPVVVDADATRLTQIVANLLTNAIKYTPPGGHIEIRVAVQGDQVACSVRDTGIGIPAEALRSVFDMFSQLVPALDRAQGGLGIGLALVRGVVDLHGGTIVASSEGVGRGSEFTVRLPLSHAAALTCTEAPLATAPRPHRILVVDDNHDAAKTMAVALELMGHQTHVAHDGPSCLAAAPGFAPDLILLDIGLPGMSGYEVARQIRLAPWGEAIYLVAATGWGQDADRAMASSAGFDRHLTKPIDFSDLNKLIVDADGLMRTRRGAL